jgi:hypothetical protein
MSIRSWQAVMKTLTVCVILSLFASWHAPSLAQTSRPSRSSWVQDRFAIGFWEEPPVDDKMDERYAEIAEANFTVVLGGHRATNTKKVARQLDLCAKYDLKAIVWRIGSMSDIIKNQNMLPEHPACWGYHLKDEPGAASFPGIGRTVAAIRRARPDKLAYVNLFPHHAGPKHLGTPTYAEHLERYITETGADLISMDHYPQISPSGDTRHEYCQNLELMRTAALAHDIPWWNYFNAIRFGGRTDPTESKMRWQIWTSLAYGAKGVWYFTYWTGTYDGGLAKNPGSFAMTSALIDLQGRRTRRWEQAKRINAAVKNLGPTLMKLTSTAVIRVTRTDDPAEILKQTPLKTIGEWSAHKGVPQPTDEGDYLIGTFRHADGREAVLINNYHYAHNLWPTVQFRAAASRIAEVCQRTGREIPLEDDSPRMALLPDFKKEGVSLSIEAGGGRLFLIR